MSSGSTAMEEAQRRTWYLRVVFVVSLLVAAAICGIVSYSVVSNLELSVGTQTYESVAASALKGAQAITHRKLQSSDAMASVLSNAFPNADQWPNVALSGYVDTANRVAKLSQTLSLVMITLLLAGQV